MSSYTFVITKKDIDSFETTFDGETKKLYFNTNNRYYEQTFKYNLPVLHAYFDIHLKWYGPEYNEIDGWNNIATNNITLYYTDNDAEECYELNPILRYENAGFKIEYKDFNKTGYCSGYSFKHFWNAWKVHVMSNNQDKFESLDRFKTNDFIIEKSKKEKFEKFIHNYLCMVPDDMDELEEWKPKLMADYKAFILKEDLTDDVFYEDEDDDSSSDSDE
jgi:hypothetical protein